MRHPRPTQQFFFDVSVPIWGGTPSDAEEYGLKVNLSTNASVIGEELKFSDEYKFKLFSQRTVFVA